MPACRCGRTGRAGQEGVSIALVAPSERMRFLALCRTLERPEPPEFPMELSVLPQARERVRLAVQLDGLERSDKKDRVDKDWYRRNAELAGIDIDDSDEDIDEIRRRHAAKKVIREAGWRSRPARVLTQHAPLLQQHSDREEDPSNKSAKLKAQLARMVAEPLVPKMSTRYFTGGALAMGSLLPGAIPAGSKAGAEEGSKEGAEAAAVDAVNAAAAPRVMQMAAQLKDARIRAEADLKAREDRQRKKEAKKRRKGQEKVDPRQAALQKALAAATKKKGGKKLVVVPSAFGRAAQGPDALAALRAKLEK